VVRPPLGPRAELQAHQVGDAVGEEFGGVVDAGRPGWTAPADDELAEHFDDRLLAAVPPGRLVGQLSQTAPDLREELIVISARRRWRRTSSWPGCGTWRRSMPSRRTG
jgi:hypothetical protein